MYTVNIYTELGIKILYIKEINNSILLPQNVQISDGTFSMTKSNILKIINEYSPNDEEKFSKILNYRENIEISEEASTNSSVYTLCMHPSVKCNLSCEYCFAKKTDELPNKEIDINMAKKAIDYLIYHFGKDGVRYIIDISGSGEPLLNFSIIKEIEAYCESKRNETGKEIKIMFPTNATLLDEEKAKYFISKPNILLGISIDGNDRQCQNRKLKNEGYAYNKIEHGINLVKDRSVGFAVTLTDKNEDVDILFDYLYKTYRNVDAISMQLVRDFDYKSSTSFYNINIDNLIYHYKLLVNNLIKSIKKQQYDYIFTLLRGVDTFGTYILRVVQKGKFITTRCGAGKDRISIDNKGNIYTCPVLTGNELFHIGNITDGIDREKQRIHCYKNTQINSDCKQCWAAYICGGECAATSYICNNDIYKPNKKICEFRRKLIKLSIAFVELLKLQYPLAYNTLAKYAETKVLFTNISDSGLWTINKYFNIKNINVTNTDIIQKVPRCEQGIKPNQMQKYIQNYEKNINAYEITDIKQYYKLNYPVIAYQNKKETIFYEYCIIHGIKNDMLEIEMIDTNTNVINIPITLFNSQISSIIFQNEI